MMTNQVLCIEHSETLIIMGVPIEKASLVWTIVDGYETVVDRELCLPENINGYAFTVYDLLRLLPNEIDGYSLKISKNGVDWIIEYSKSEDEGITTLLFHNAFFCNDELLQALFNVVRYLLNIGYSLRY